MIMLFAHELIFNYYEKGILYDYQIYIDTFGDVSIPAKIWLVQFVYHELIVLLVHFVLHFKLHKLL